MPRVRTVALPVALLVMAAGVGRPAVAGPQTAPPANRPDLSGVYEAIPDGMTLPGGLRNAGDPADVPLLPAAVDQMRAVDLQQDPAKLCQPIGPFRMMARDGLTFEIVPVLARGIVALLFEDVSRGHMRTIVVDRPHPGDVEPTWHGHSVARWEGDTLVIDTLGFNERTWLNDEGAQHGEALRLTERIRQVLAGRYLEYQVTADDPAVLRSAYTYTRYFAKSSAEIGQDVCEE